MRKKGKKATPARVQSVRAVILAIDSSKCSGLSIHVPDGTEWEIETFCEVRTQAARRAFAEQALEIARELKLPLIVVSEDWTRHGMSNKGFASLCASWGKWLAAFEDVGIDSKCIVRVMSCDWRAVVYADVESVPRDSDSLKALAVQHVQDTLDVPLVSHDIAESMLLGVWGRTSGEVQTIAEKELRKCARKAKSVARDTRVAA